jgi:general L-amino acid transport system substrate-binding protein
MKITFLFGSAIALALGAGAASAATLDDVKARGALKCGVNTGFPGFAFPDAEGKWQGFDVALCRAVAAAVLGDGEKVEFVPLTSETRFTALTSGEVDVLSRNSTWTFTRDADLKLTFAGVNYYDGQGFMVSKDLGVASATELDGATVCVQTGTTTEVNLSDYFKVNNISYQPVPTQTPAEADQQFLGGACDAYTTDASQLATSRGSYENPDNYIILPEIISKEPLGPVVRQGDDQWADIVRWTLNALVAAEDYGVTSQNIEEMLGSQDAEVKRLLGVEGDLGLMLGLDAEWAKRAIMAGGNYGELFAASIGEGTPSNIARGLNAQWKDGGLQYSPPFR